MWEQDNHGIVYVVKSDSAVVIAAVRLWLVLMCSILDRLAVPRRTERKNMEKIRVACRAGGDER